MWANRFTLVFGAAGRIGSDDRPLAHFGYQQALGFQAMEGQLERTLCVLFRHTLCYTPPVKYFAWDQAKNERLKAERGIAFETIVFQIERGDLLDILEHANPERYPGQRIFVVKHGNYVYLVPFVEDEAVVFLKTIIPSRKATKQYLGEELEDDEA